jgi:plasmid maintenance system killer protein
MIVEFAQASLTLIETEKAAETDLPVYVIRAVRQKLAILHAAPDLRTLRNLKCLGLVDDALKLSEPCEIEIAPNWSMVLQARKNNEKVSVVVVAIDEKLRGAA